MNEDEFFLDQQKCPYVRIHGLPQVAFIYLFIHSFYLGHNVTFCLCFVLGNVFVFVLFCLFVFFFFFFLSLGMPFFLSWLTLPLFHFFFNKKLVMFFFGHDFYFLINFSDCSFFFFFFYGYLLLFCFNWTPFFNKDIWINLFKLIFSISPLFHSQPNKTERK